MKTALVSSIPRSGTWAIKYFFYFLGHFTKYGADAPIDIRDAYQRVTNPTDTSHLSHLGVHEIRNDHFTFPGTPEDYASPSLAYRIRSLKRRLCFEEFDQRQRLLTHTFEPKHFDEQRCVVVHRNVFDQFMSMVRSSQQSQRNYHLPGLEDRQWPMDVSMFADLGHDAPMEHYFERMLASLVIECYALYILTFLAGRQAYGANRVTLVRYETLEEDPLKFFTRIVNFIGVDVDRRCLAASVHCISRPRMAQYEQTLGHTLSSDRSRPSHMAGTRHGPYSDYVSPMVAQAVKTRLKIWGIENVVWDEKDDMLLADRGKEYVSADEKQETEA